jgi:type II secretion system protein G
MKILHHSEKNGFTLIELLVVIAIIAILTGIIITGLVGSKAKARDGERASDLSQISLALEQFFDRCDVYPTSLNINDDGLINSVVSCPKDASNNQITLGNFISKIPTDPTNSGVYVYSYATNSTYTDYVLHTTFEASNSVLAQSAPLPSGFPTGWTVTPSGSISTCNNQATQTSVPGGLDYCVRPN